MESWIVITFCAAFLQNLRSATQKHLKATLGTLGATLVRFLFGIPFAILFLMLVSVAGSEKLPAISGTFLLWTALGGLSQIVATALLLHGFSFHNFVVGSAYSRTEPIHAAIFGALLLSDRLSPTMTLAVLICVVGVMMMAIAKAEVSRKGFFSSVFSRAVMIGLSSGVLFGLSAISFRGATLALETGSFLMRAGLTLNFAIIFQTFLVAIWLWKTEREVFIKLFEEWKPSLFAGATGASASFLWFAAFSLQQAALVKSLAQVEMLFTLASSVLFFREKITLWELVGAFLVVVGIVVLVLL